MKILPNHENLRSLIYWLIGIGGIVIFFFPYWIAYSFRAQILWFILALFFIFTPTAGKKPNTNVMPLSFIKSLLLTFLLQITLMLAFYTICDVTEFGMPNGPVPFSLFQTSTLILLTSWGAFPWGIYALLAVALSYTVYIKHQPGDMSTLVRPLLKNAVGDVIGLTADLAIKIAITFTLACTLGMIAMECISLIAYWLDLRIAYGIRPDLLIALLVILKWNQENPFKKPLNWCLKHKIPSFLTVGGFLLAVIICLLMISSFIDSASPRFTPLLSRTIYFSPNDWAFVWATFAGIWWLGWAPIAAGMLAYIWRGYSMRTIIFYTLLLPAVVSACLTQYPDWLIINLNNRLWNFIPAVLSAVTIILLFLNTQSMTYCLKASLPANSRYYQRNPRFLLTQLFQGIIIIMGLYWAGGAYLPGMIYFVFVFPAGLLAMLAGIASFRGL